MGVEVEAIDCCSRTWWVLKTLRAFFNVAMPPRTAPNPTNLDDSDGEHSERLPRKNSKSTACQPYSVPAVIWSRRTISLVLDHAQYELKGVAHERGDFLDGRKWSRVFFSFTC